MPTSPRAIIFDLGGTLVAWPDWDDDAPRRWMLSYDYLREMYPGRPWPDQQTYVTAMRAAELAHWQRVEIDQWSGPPSSVLLDGFRRLDRSIDDAELMAALDGYALAVDGWAVAVPGAVATLEELSARGYRIGLLSNTWWAATWHNRDLAVHGLAGLFDDIVYTSDLPHSKPHPFVFREVAKRLDVEPSACVMVGDQMVADISGALAVGMRAVWIANEGRFSRASGVTPSATIQALPDLLSQLSFWGGT